MNKTKWLLAALVVCSLLMSCGTDADYDDMDGETAEETESIDMANDGLGGDVPERGGSNTEEVQKLDVSHLGGMWLPDTVGETDYLEIRPDDSTFTLYGDYGQIDGWFGYDDADQTVYAYDTDGTGCVFEELEDGRIYFSMYGYFSPMYDGSDEEINIADYLTPIPELAGEYYLNGDLSASVFLVLDTEGNWTYFERADGDAEAYAVDSGYLIASDTEITTYYAYSTEYDGTSYRVFEFDKGILLWGEEGITFERTEGVG